MYEVAGIEFDQTELRDLALAWLSLGLAFTFFLAPTGFVQRGFVGTGFITRLFVRSILTVGTAFLLHELAHKVVAVRFGQIAAFRADYGMLALAVASGLAGFLFAAPGAVYHRGHITVRENGLVAVAGPVTNIVLAVGFFPVFLLFSGFVGEIGRLGVLVNAGLGAFNMVPFGPLDGKSVFEWHRGVFALVLATAAGIGAGFLLTFGL